MKKISFTLVFFILQITLFGYETKLKDTCKIVSININKDGSLEWITKNETEERVFIIEEYRWNKWVKIGEIYGKGLPQEMKYSFKIIPYSGKNQIRVIQENESNISKKIEFTSYEPKVKFTIEKVANEIKFSNKTMYEIVNSLGEIVKRGLSDSISYENLPKGSYTLNYDNSTTKFER